MSLHHWMYFGCQCSSARWSRLLPERLTLFGIFSAEIIAASLSTRRTQRTQRTAKKRQNGFRRCKKRNGFTFVSLVSSVLNLLDRAPTHHVRFQSNSGLP